MKMKLMKWSRPLVHSLLVPLQPDHSSHGFLVTPPDGACTESVSGGVTLLRISSTKHKERPLR
nr:hypothetical protein [Tanacetum cinerariifolium]